ncbi:MAG TPA: helix-turn-helix domain-containing protein [Streptosporangiaceae bacterium]|nr:helix-turn-helix domain-containing protein [Streptosporangiaceae bacterium]
MSLESDEPTSPADAAGPAGPGSADRLRGQRRRLLDDPRSMRALAHPLRLELQVIVGRAGRITTADAARILGISHALASHHLHQLAKYGFVEQVSGADNRERPWRLVSTSTSYQGLEDKPGGAAAVQAFEQVAAERTIESLLDWQERREHWSAGWREHSGIGRSGVYLTEGELAGLVTDIDKLILRYVEERPIDDLETRPPGSVPVELTLFVIPRDPVDSPRDPAGRAGDS